MISLWGMWYATFYLQYIGDHNIFCWAKLLQMNPWPYEHCALVLDNCRIHHNTALVEAIHNAGWSCNE